MEKINEIFPRTKHYQYSIVIVFWLFANVEPDACVVFLTYLYYTYAETVKVKCMAEKEVVALSAACMNNFMCIFRSHMLYT